MKDYQRERLYNFLDFFAVSQECRILYVTLCEEDSSQRERRAEKAFLKELESYYASRKITLETYPIHRLQSMWDDRMYDVILLRYVLFHQRDQVMDERKCLRLLARHLLPEGRMYVMENNRFAARTMAGDRFDGLEKERGLSRKELVEAFRFAELKMTMYYPHPFMEDMDYLFSDRRLPQGETLRSAIREGTARMEFFSEGELLSAAEKEGLFPSFANQFLCEAWRQAAPARLIFRHYQMGRDRKFRIKTSVRETADGGHTITYEPLGEPAAAFVRDIADSGKIFSKVYQGYTLQIEPCVFDQGRTAMRQSPDVSVEELLDDLLEREEVDEFFQLLRRVSDVLTAPTRISALQNSGLRGVHFSDNPQFVRMFGTFFGSEDELFYGEPVLPISPIDARFSDFHVRDKRWTLTRYDWAVDFPVPFSFVLYRMIHRYFAEVPHRDPEGTLTKEVYAFFHISERMLDVFARMEERFHSYVTGRAITAEQIRAQAIKGGSFLPVEDFVSAFLDLNKGRELERSEAFEEVGGGFKKKMLGVLSRFGLH